MSATENNDTRFQFEVIKQLAESVRTMGDTQTRMLERLARIEEHRVHEAVTDVSRRLDAIEKVHAEERGAAGVRKAVMMYWPAIALFLLVFWTAGRALGFFHLPDRPETVQPIRSAP